VRICGSTYYNNGVSYKNKFSKMEIEETKLNSKVEVELKLK